MRAENHDAQLAVGGIDCKQATEDGHRQKRKAVSGDVSFFHERGFDLLDVTGDCVSVGLAAIKKRPSAGNGLQMGGQN
jgi:hypothetical protein